MAVVSTGAGAAVAAGAVASAAATRAHVRRCEETIHNYDSRTATISEMQSYSECVEYIHPKSSEMPQGVAVVLLVAVIIGAVIGFFNGDDVVDRIALTVLGGISGILGLFVIGGFIMLVCKALGAT